MSIIAGISTPIGNGAISIVRMSGEGALEIALRFFSCKKIKNEGIIPNMMYLGTFDGGEFKDRCLFVYFKSPKTYTGEDLVEFHLHGGVTVTQKVLHTLLQNGAVMAENGEFTKRAFLNGKISLDEAEGILGLINAESETEIAASYGVMKGNVSKRIEPVADKLIKITSMLEAWFDYPEEMEDDVQTDVFPTLREIKSDLEKLLSTAKQGRMIHNGISVALVGRPNVGKSSVLNALLKEERAIVTDIPGTTRDTIAESIVYKGVRINLLDTAGIRESTDVVEKLGIERSLDAVKKADIVLYILDATKKEKPDLSFVKDGVIGKIFFVYNKTDVADENAEYINVSAKEGKGIDDLLDKIVAEVGDKRMYGEMLTVDRHISAVARALDGINSVLDNPTVSYDCMLVDLKESLSSLLEIDGGAASEKIIDDIFSRFCVGK